MSQSEGLESLLMSFTWPSILQAVESSVEIMCDSLEDVTRPSEIVIFNVSFHYMSVAFFRFEHIEPEGDTLNLTKSNSLNTNFHEWHLFCLQVAPCLL